MMNISKAQFDRWTEMAGGPTFLITAIALLPILKLYAPRSLWTVAFLTMAVVLSEILDQRLQQRLQTASQRNLTEVELSESRLISIVTHGAKSIFAAAFGAFAMLAVLRQL